MQVKAAGLAGPGLALLLRLVALEGTAAIALGAMSMLAIGSVARAPQMLKAGVVIGEVGKELMHRVLRSRGLRPDRLMAVAGGMCQPYLTMWRLSSRLDRIEV